MGVASFLTASDSAHVSNPRHLAATAGRLAAAQRDLARKKRGSSRRRKAVVKVARLHGNVRRQRLDHAHCGQGLPFRKPKSNLRSRSFKKSGGVHDGQHHHPTNNQPAPDFDSRSYGVGKLSDLIKATTLFEIERRSPGDGKQALVHARAKRSAAAAARTRRAAAPA
jgi:hypothetical protein